MVPKNGRFPQVLAAWLCRLGDRRGGARGLLRAVLARYGGVVKRLLQLVTFLLLVAAFVQPLLEWFDRWDAPGLANDSELGFLFLAVCVCLVLVVVRVVAACAMLISIAAERLSRERHRPELLERAETHLLRPPLLEMPLRI